MVNPALEWLAARLGRGPMTPSELRDAALAIGITPAELEDAKTRLRVRREVRVPEGGGREYVVLTMDPIPTSGPFRKGWDPRRALRTAAEPEPVEVEVVQPKKTDPKERIKQARARLERKALRHVKMLEELTNKLEDSDTPCPTCKRGMPRAEDIRLRALKEVLDRSGLVGPKAGVNEDGDTGPVLIFPVGTKLAVLAQPPESAPVEMRITRADQL